MARTRDLIAITLALGLALVSAACSPQRHHEAVLVMGDIAAGAGPSRLKRSTPEPQRSSVTYSVAGRAHSAYLYLPGDGEPQAGLVLVPGAVPAGADDTTFVQFATTLARARFAVLTPELTGQGDIQVRAEHVTDVADAFAYLASDTRLAPGGRAGIAAVSYGVGPAVLAALAPQISRRVRFVLGIGGYYDLREAIRYFTTGYFSEDGTSIYREPNPYGKLVLASSVLDGLRSSVDRSVMRAMIDERLRNPDADLSVLASQLGPEGIAAYRLIENRDPNSVSDLLAELPQTVTALIDALDLANKPLTSLDARFIFVHGRDDPLIPYPHSLALGNAIGPERARVFVLNRILGHVDLTLPGVFSAELYRERLPDLWRLFRAVDLLLREREADGSG